MSLILKGLLAAFWLIFVPCAAGQPFMRKNENHNPGKSLITGYMVMFCVMEVLTLPMILLKLPLHVLAAAFCGLMLAAGAWGVVCIFKKSSPAAGETGRGWKRPSLYMCAAILLILMQVCILVLFAHMDADDSFYVGAATTAVETDTIFSVNPYTGVPYANLPSRYVLSPFPVFLAVVSRLCGGLHPAIMAHVAFPAVFVPFSYLVLHQLGKKWFPKERDSQGIFLVLCAVLTWFAGYSIYNAGNFEMVRIWQGKAFLAAAFLPLVIYFCLTVLMEKKPEDPWIYLAMVNLSCCLLSSMGIILAPLVTGVFLLLSLVKFRSLERLTKGALCCLPSILLGVVYLLIR